MAGTFEEFHRRISEQSSQITEPNFTYLEAAKNKINVTRVAAGNIYLRLTP